MEASRRVTIATREPRFASALAEPGTRGGLTMATLNWSAIDSDPRFRELHDRKIRFLWGLMAFSIVYYFLLPIGAGYFPELYRVKVWGPINVGLLFALSQFLVAWGIAYHYARRASQFDEMAAEIARAADTIGGRS
jgi:uncharacterized membrane protein (DUF485 family)